MFFVLNLVQVVDSSTVATTRHTVLTHRLQHHSLLNALFEATILTPIALRLCNLAGPICYARVHASILYCTFEESLAALTCDDTVVQTSSLVFTDHTNKWLFVLFEWMILVTFGQLRTSPLLL